MDVRDSGLGLADNVLEQLWFGDDLPDRSRLEASRSMAAAAAVAAGLKPLPIVASRVLRLMSQEEPKMTDLRDVIETDPALTGRVLRVANSSLYRARGEIRSVGEALLRLGMKRVGGIITGLLALGLFADAKGLGARFQEHSAAVGVIAKTLESDWYGRPLENALLYGLLHDIGKLLTMQVGELLYDELDQEILASPEALHAVERRLLGYDHAVLGAHVLVKWEFPFDIAEVVALHHQPGRAYESGSSVALGVSFVRLADAVEYQMRVSREPDPAFLEALSRGDAASYSGMTVNDLTKLWPRFVDAIDASVMMLHQ
jgi:putative nucleotidyltransferase with HDIG domain